MLTVDTFLNPEVVGKSHTSGRNGEYKDRCVELFSTPEVQQKMMKVSSALAVLVRLY